jgi:formate C-acetyltransferase
LTIGGQTPDGNDATNEMSYIVLDAISAIRLVQPAIAIRLHRNTPTEFLYAIAKALKTCAGVYSFFNDEEMIPYLMSLGIPLEDARNYATEGCMRWIIPGKAMGMRALGGSFILPRCLEFALTQGWDKFSGKQWGYATPDPLTFTSIEDVIEAYLTQVRFFFQKLATIYNMVDVLDGEYLPQPLLSAMLDGCIAHGQDCRQYKYFPNTIFQPVGQITVVNSLAAMKKLIFDDKKVSVAQLLDALRNSWEGDGRGELHQMFINAPKFGNDDDYVDLLARDVFLRTTQVFRSFKNIWGGPFLEDGTGGSNYYAYSGLTGATPDGRKDRGLFNDGTVSPMVGTDKKGPTAVLKSVGKIDHERTFTHLFNQKFLPLYLSDEYKDAFAAYMRTFVNLGIHHIQFNVVDRQVFLDAQQHPENYGDLVVRVAGFSSYFVDLEKELQDQIIARTEQTL